MNHKIFQSKVIYSFGLFYCTIEETRNNSVKWYVSESWEISVKTHIQTHMTHGQTIPREMKNFTWIKE